jgi:transposase
MDHIQPINRNQIEMICLEQQIEADNAVRFIDAFVEKLDLAQLQFQLKPIATEGRPPYAPKIFLKLYIYGYLNGLRSSRRLAKECMRNIELHWLLGKLQPNYHSIADFRKQNPTALKNTFKLFVLFLKSEDLIAGNIIAIDGTKVRAHNSKKNNYSPKKIKRHLTYIEERTNAYLQELEQNDVQEQSEKVKAVKQKIERLQRHKIQYELLQTHLTQTGETQVSTTDSDARALLVQGQVVEVCYNTQAAVDAKYKLVVATHTINKNDRNALTAISAEAKQNLKTEAITVLSDKGYHNGRELAQCKEQNITTICAQQQAVNSNNFGTTEAYLVQHFQYNPQDDTYTCPARQTLTTTGYWHKKTRERDNYQFKKYRTPACKTCPVKHLCTGRAQGGREIERSQYAEAVEQNAQRYKTNPELYRTRQEINEHIFGTIKRTWGYYYTNLKGLEKVNGEYALIMTVYNMKRCITIFGMPELLKRIQHWTPDYKAIFLLCIKQHYFNAIWRFIFLSRKITT